MQTFLPFADFALSAASLDDRRLGKQRVENMQIMKALLTGSGWANHPATKQWQGYEIALLDYQLAVCDEWAVVRQFSDSCADKTIEMMREYGYHPQALDNYLATGNYEDPPWLGRAEYHLSHQSNLIRKNAQHYRRHFPDAPLDLPYYWPSQH